MPRRSRPARVQNHHSSALRSELAQTAARLIAEDGLEYGAAKKKAARQLGLPENFPLPGNEEVQDAVRDYHAIYQEEEQAELLVWLRSVAVELMRLLERFSPYLTGSVLDGTATRHSRIDLLLFPDSAKEVEIFLLNEGIHFRHGTPRSDRVEAVLMLEEEDLPANLIVLQPREERIHFKGADGRSRARAKLDAVIALLRDGKA